MKLTGTDAVDDVISARASTDGVGDVSDVTDFVDATKGFRGETADCCGR